MIQLTNIWQVLEAVLMAWGFVQSVRKWGEVQKIQSPGLGFVVGLLTYGLILGMGGFWAFPFGWPQAVMVGFIIRYLYIIFGSGEVVPNPYQNLLLSAANVVVLHYGRFW